MTNKARCGRISEGEGGLAINRTAKNIAADRLGWIRDENFAPETTTKGETEIGRRSRTRAGFTGNFVRRAEKSVFPERSSNTSLSPPPPPPQPQITPPRLRLHLPLVELPVLRPCVRSSRSWKTRLFGSSRHRDGRVLKSARCSIISFKRRRMKKPGSVSRFFVFRSTTCVRCSLSVVVTAVAAAVHLRSIARRPVVTPAAIYLNVRRQSATAFAATAAAAACRT